MREIQLIVLISLIVGGCFLKKSTEDTINTDYDKGVVYDKRGLDGCTYIIKLDSGKNLEPINLSDEFQQDSLPVYVNYKRKKGVVSICMVGTIVEIIDIKKADKVKKQRQ